VATPRQRMVPPGLAVDLGLTPLLKRVVYIGLMQIAEDSGCFIWSARDVRSAALPLERDVTDEDVEQTMIDLEEDGHVWAYEAEGVRCGYVAAFHEHQHSLTRWNAPQSVPTPPGLLYENIPSSQRYGSCRYTPPKTRAAMLGAQSATQPPNQPLTLPANHSITQGAVDSLPAACEEPAVKEKPCALCGGSGLMLDHSPCTRCRPQTSSTST